MPCMNHKDGYTKGDKKLPTSKEHLDKYKTNRNVLNSALDVKNAQHYDWITTICFYSSLHIIEAEFAKKSINNFSHEEREKRMRDSDLFGRKISDIYKQLSTYSKIARYGSKSVGPTIASKSIEWLGKIEQELLREGEC